MNSSHYTTLFLDIGGVLLTNGWDHSIRESAAKTFSLDLIELNKRHALTFDTYEIGKISLDVYLDRVVFYMPRPFERNEFKEFMFSRSEPYVKMIELIRDVKERYSLRIVALSNEGRELMLHRINHFKLREFIDFFVCSCFIGCRKPDIQMYHFALDMAQVSPHEVIYIDDRAMLTEIGSSLGLQIIQHKNYDQTQKIIHDLLLHKTS
ncbi:MAG: HAD family hydrolase [Parachlamydiaceae bacterium]